MSTDKNQSGADVNETNEIQSGALASTKRSYVADGMPPLDLSGRNTSFFEFWPTWLIYLPVVLQWLLLAIRYRSLSLPLIANPSVPLSGMVGVPKSTVFEVAGDEANRWILPWSNYRLQATPLADQVKAIIVQLHRKDIAFPFVAKPNIGCRGAGVKLVENAAQLQDYLRMFPARGEIQFQKLADWDAEAGVFYVREPGQARGRVTSLTLKYTPYIVGDGQHTLAELVAKDPRAGELIHLYKQRHRANWDVVIAAGLLYRLVFSASHCRGAVFRDARQLISDSLTERLDSIFNDIPDFYYGRLDIKFKDTQSLVRGENFAIIEINGASSESINIWDRKTSLFEAITTLLQQYSTLFKLGHLNRLRGHKPPGLLSLYRAWRYETNLVKDYPQND